jgi:hypothetical protein
MHATRLWLGAIACLALATGSLAAQGNTPEITGLAPDNKAAGSGEFSLVVNGTNFRNNARVLWNGSPRTTDPVEGGLSARIYASDIAQPGTATIKVEQVVGRQNRESNAVSFTITATGGSSPPSTAPPPGSNPIPSATALSPTQARIGGPKFDLNVIGSNFVQGAEVRWGGVARRTTLHTATHLVAEIPASDITIPGTVQITVYNPGPGGGTSAALPFERIHYAPTIASLNPKSATRGSSSFTLTVGGANYLSGASTVLWNGDSLATEFVSGSQLRAAVPAARLTSSGDVAITVVTRVARSVRTSSPATFTIYEAVAGTLTASIPLVTPAITNFYVGGSSNPERVIAGRPVPLYVTRTGLATHWRVSRTSIFRGASWQAIATTPTFTFATADTSLTVPQTLHFQYRYVSGSDTTLSTAASDQVIVRPVFSAAGVTPVVAGRTTGTRQRRLCAAGQVMTGVRWRQDQTGVIAVGIVCAGTNQTLVGNTTGGTLYAPGGCSSQGEIPTALVTVPSSTIPAFIGLVSDASGCVENPLGSTTAFDPAYATAVPGTYRGSNVATVQCADDAFPIGIDAYIDTIKLLVVDTQLAGVVGLGFVCAKRE